MIRNAVLARSLRFAAGIAATALLALGIPASALAHGYAPPPGSILDVLLRWTFDWYTLLPLAVAAWLYWLAVRKVNAAHPNNPVPLFRSIFWFGGLLTLLVALCSPIGVYDDTLFWVHMVQHLMLTMVAAPLLVLGAPITLLLRVSSADARRRVILPVLHSRPVRVIGHPIVTWTLFAAVMWGSHFSPLFNASLDNDAIHVFEHALYLTAGLLFWWPVVGADPSPWRLPHPARVAYLFLGMPQSSFLGLAIFSAPGVLYAHYATLIRNWGPTPLEDQAWAGGIMWAGGDMMFLIAMILALWVWLRAEEQAGRLADEKLDREEALRARLSGRPATLAATTTQMPPAPASQTSAD